MNSTNGGKGSKIWLVIVLIVALISCCCLSSALGGALFLRPDDMSLGDWFSDLIGKEPQSENIEAFPEESGPSLDPNEEDPTDPTALIQDEGEATLPPPQAMEEFLLAITSSGIWKVGIEFQEAQQLCADEIDPPLPYRKGLSPDKKYYAYIAGDLDPMLVILNLETNKQIYQTPLSSPASQIKPNMDSSDPGLSVLLAMQSSGSLAWSPDSLHLAFVAAMDDDNTDLYLLDTTDLSVSRLTNENSNAAYLNWSPDGRLIEFVTIDNFGTGAGMDMDAVWVYDLSQGAVTLLEESTSGGEVFISWIDNESFYINSWSRMCSDYNLRSVNAITGSQEISRESCFSGAAYDPIGKMGLLSVSDLFIDSCLCGDVDEFGTFIFGEILELSGIATEIKKFEKINAYNIELVESGTLFAVFTDQGLSHLFNTKGSPIPIPSVVAGLEPYPSPGGDYWAWYPYYGEETGLWIMDRQDKLFEVSDTISGNILWQDSGDRVFFIESNQIFYANAPDFQTSLLAELPVNQIFTIVN